MTSECRARRRPNKPNGRELHAPVMQHRQPGGDSTKDAKCQAARWKSGGYGNDSAAVREDMESAARDLPMELDAAGQIGEIQVFRGIQRFPAHDSPHR